MARTLLAVYAHPDDEVFGAGGTLAHYASQGVRVVLACATRGEAGEISDPSLATPETLGEVRERELRESGTALGISDVRFLGYRDSGMAGTPDNDDPRSYHRADPEAATRQLVGLMREVRPQAVITFEPFGGYGHPDHIAVSRYTTAAFDAAGDPARFPDAGSEWQPGRLFYSLIPNRFFREIREHLERLGVDTSEIPRREEMPGRPPDEAITTEVDVAGFAAAKWAASHAHRTQFSPDSLFRRLPEDIMLAMIGREYFIQVRPADGSGPVTGDLFAGL
jgi:N-acetyl-1-D-myo-inositol-2-amino-2-deoxy-alpha-D-glucopyranoside deacetylase